MSTKTSKRIKQCTTIRNTQSHSSVTGPGSITTVRGGQSINCDKSRTGVANPKWRSQILRGENASTDFSATENTGKLIDSKYDRWNKNLPSQPTITSHHWGNCVGAASDVVSLPVFMSTLKADNIARQRFYKQAIKACRYLQSGVFIGELRQTLSLIRNPAKSARLLIDVFAKNVIRRARPPRGRSRPNLSHRDKLKYLKNALADSWLEFSFGWSPLAADIDAAYRLLTDLSTKTNRQFAEVKGSDLQFDKQLVSSALTGFSSDRPYSVLQTQVRYTEVRVKYYGRIKLEVPDLSADRYMTALGLTIADILPTTWELIPWSFFVDYFTNVGDVIEAWSFPASKLAWATKVIVEERKSATQWSYNDARTKTLMGANNWISMFVSRDAHRISGEKRVTRTATVYVRPPEFRFENPFSGVKRSLNIGALMATSRRAIR